MEKKQPRPLLRSHGSEWGIGNFSRYIDPESSYRLPIYAHNLFLDFSSETGIICAGLLLLLLLSPIVCFLNNKNPTKKSIGGFFPYLAGSFDV